MTFTEEWFGEASQLALARLATLTDGVPGRVIEVGCWEGRSTVALANAVHPATVDAVDTWAGSPGEISADLAGRRDVYATFADNVAELTAGNVAPHRMGWRDYFAADLGPVRFIHIDAEHTYREAFDTITTVLPLMSPGGIICGDDAHHLPVISAVVDALGPVDREATLWVWEVPDGARN